MNVWNFTQWFCGFVRKLVCGRVQRSCWGRLGGAWWEQTQAEPLGAQIDAGRVEREPRRRQWTEWDETDGRFHKEQGFHRSSSLALLFLFALDVLTISQADRGMVWKDKSAQSSPCFKPSVVPLPQEQNPSSFIFYHQQDPRRSDPFPWPPFPTPPPLCALGWNHPWHLDVCWKSLLNKEIHPWLN